MSDTGAGVFRIAVTLAISALLCVPWCAAAGETSEQFSSVAMPKQDLLAYLADPATFTLVDARSANEFASGHIAGAINLSHDASEAVTARSLPDADLPIVVYCKTGKRAARLQKRLVDLGYTDVRTLEADQVVWFDSTAVFNCGLPQDLPTTGEMMTRFDDGIVEERE